MRVPRRAGRIRSVGSMSAAPPSKRRSFSILAIVGADRKTPVSVLEVLRSWRYAEAQPVAPVRGAPSRKAVLPVLTTGACMAATLRLVVPLLTLEAGARGGGGGDGGGGHGGGGNGGGHGGEEGGGHGGGRHGGGYGGEQGGGHGG